MILLKCVFYLWLTLQLINEARGTTIRSLIICWSFTCLIDLLDNNMLKHEQTWANIGSKHADREFMIDMLNQLSVLDSNIYAYLLKNGINTNVLGSLRLKKKFEFWKISHSHETA